jgi:uncharacterized protein
MSAAAIIVGEVVHERFRPANHKFTYPLFCLRIPLGKLVDVAQHIAVNRRGLVSFQERDHGVRDGSSTLAWVRKVLIDNDVATAAEDQIEVDLHCFPRMLGYVFNPVSFWVCRRFTQASDEVCAVLVEVNNTFGQSHSYLLTPGNGRSIESGELLSAAKQLHVSPFNEVRGGYQFRFNFAADRWMARIDYYDGNDGEGPLLHTHISGVAQPLTQANLRRAALHFPLQTLAVVARIHWHALRLFAKRVPFFGKLASTMTGISRS